MKLNIPYILGKKIKYEEKFKTKKSKLFLSDQVMHSHTYLEIVDISEGFFDEKMNFHPYEEIGLKVGDIVITQNYFKEILTEDLSKNNFYVFSIKEIIAKLEQDEEDKKWIAKKLKEEK